MKFKTIYDSQEETKLISPKLNNGEFDYYLIINLLDFHEMSGDTSGLKYAVQILAVSPDSVSAENMRRALESLSMDRADLTDLLRAEALADYGICANLWSQSSNNRRDLLKAARREIKLIEMLFGFYMDRPENRIGQDGWNLIKGQDLREFYAERKSDYGSFPLKKGTDLTLRLP